MINDGPTLIAEATEALIGRLVRHGIPEVEVRQRLQVAWSVPTAIPLPTLEELDGMRDGSVIKDDEMEA